MPNGTIGAGEIGAAARGTTMSQLRNKIVQQTTNVLAKRAKPRFQAERTRATAMWVSRGDATIWIEGEGRRHAEIET